MFKFKTRNSKNWNHRIKIWENKTLKDGTNKIIICIDHTEDNSKSYGAYGVFYKDKEDLLKELNNCTNKEYLELVYK